MLCVFPEQKKKDSDDIDHDAIAHRLKQDVVSIKTWYSIQLEHILFALDFSTVIAYEALFVFPQYLHLLG